MRNLKVVDFLIIILLVVVAWLVLTEVTQAAKGCDSRACEKRVFNKNQKFRPALASWYDGVGLGGVSGCRGYMSPSEWAQGVVAHKTLPCGTKVRICYRRCTTARVWDRGPYSGAREFDLDRHVRDRTGFDGVDIIKVKVIR